MKPVCEHPILFSDPMVCAILAGQKTQTRRVVKWRDLQPGLNLSFSSLEVFSYVPGTYTLESRTRNGVESRSSPTRCPYGQPGDRLWVREAFARIDGQTQPWIETDYRATYQQGYRLGDTLGIRKLWSPSIHMPRHASRITLEITGVRVERLGAISAADAKAEGIEGQTECGPWRNYERAGHWFPEGKSTAPKLSFASLWHAINGAGSWQTNPWVWVINFKRLEA